ncbi:DNA repair protein RecO [Candidatus Magnetaquicoccaceae bacterium FCR-1]|uniref:DNA repair protein RecO n=1 Tax=Candidatus Magnetaquiglobus chichijimensis TaxID=3141448 RepID=A0ABQ0C598_9PROT
MRISDRALALRRVPFRDDSWIVTLLTPNHGVVAAMARGARLGGRDGMRAALTGFHGLSIEIRARAPDALGSLVRAEIFEPRYRLPFLPEASSAGQLLLEAIHRLEMPYDARDGAIFHCVDGALAALESGADPLAVAAGSISRLLGLFGHGWRAGDCVGCGTRTRLRFVSVKRGGAVCEACGAPYADRLPRAGDAVLAAMADRSWPPRLSGLSHEEMFFFYQLGLEALNRIGPRPMSADASFRQLVRV